MKVLFAIIAGICLLVFTSAAANEESKPGEGGKFPSIYLTTSHHQSLESEAIFSDGDVIISFWSTSDPESRVENIKASRRAASMKGVKFISVCVDQSATMGEEISSLDGIGSDMRMLPDADKTTTQSREFFKNAVGHSYLVGADGFIRKVYSGVSTPWAA